MYLGYIKTDDIVKYCEKMARDYELTNPSYSDACGDVGNKCLDLSNRDVVEVKHGNWRGKKDCFNNIWYLCSICGGDISFKANFCPNCGADMRGKTK